jgi:protein SCO1
MRWRMLIAGSRLCAVLTVLMLVSGVGAAEQDPRWGKHYLPNVPVVTQHGQSLRLYDDVLKGKITIISFIYTTCPDICPVVTARLQQLEERLGNIVGRDIFFVSISVDPLNDTPQKLKEYAEAFGVGPSWLFLTGKTDDLQLIRYKLGDRSPKLTEHRNEILLFNETTGDWERDSAFSDINTLASTVRAMDPTWRHQNHIDEASKREVANPDPPDVPGQALFIRACASCHTIGRGDRVGPDLNGITSRKSRAWIASYVMAPEEMRSHKDPAALELATKYRTVRMPNLGLSENDASDLLAYIEGQTYVAGNKPTSNEHHHHH